MLNAMQDLLIGKMARVKWFMIVKLILNSWRANKYHEKCYCCLIMRIGVRIILLWFTIVI